MTTHIELDRETTPVKEPAKAWRNKYRALRNFIAGGDVRVVGEVYWGEKIWPSKEIAEQKAEEVRGNPNMPFGAGASEWIGAFPVDAT